MEQTEMLRAILETPYCLFDQQRAAVATKKRYVRVMAGAGAGKTETLTRRIAYLLLYQHEKPASIVAFTFTNRAAQSMKNRVYQRIAELQGQEACNTLGEMYIGTIHAYCVRILQDHFGYGNYEALDENQEMAFLMRHGWELGLHARGGNYSQECFEFLRSVALVQDELIDRNILIDKVPSFATQLTKYEALLQRHRILTFAQMVRLAMEYLSENQDALIDVRHLIVDEYQDINKAQEQLIEIIGKKATIFVVGDPRQCIYRWRGSDESYFDRFAASHGNTHQITITENNRSCMEIVKAANDIAGGFSTKFEAMKEARGQHGLLAVCECETPETEASWVIKQIDHLVRKKKLCNYSDIAVLMRSVSTSGGEFIEACRSKGIPYLVGGKIGLFRRPEALAVGYLYAWLAEDGFWVTDKWSREKIEGDNLFHEAEILINDLPGFPKFPRKKIIGWRDDCRFGKFSHFSATYQELLNILGFRLLNSSDRLQTAIMANLGRFNALLTDFESAQRRGGEIIDWERIWMNLVWFMSSYASDAYEEQPAEDLRGVDAVQIMTVHQAKGLEWPIVFVPCMTAQRFPSSRAGRARSWRVPDDLFDADRYRGGEVDELKLFYVAVTRARDVCCLSYHERITRRVGVSPFLNYVLGHAKQIKENDSLPKITIEISGDQDEIQTYSGSQIIGYLRCPNFYRLREEWNFQPGLDAALGYGKSLHHCLRLASGPIKDGADEVEAICTALDEEFHLPFAGAPIRKTMLDKARKTLTKFVKTNIEDMKKIEEVEARLEFPIEKATITGRVDVILRELDGGELEVRDYKTSDEATTPEESGLHVRLYTLGLKKMGRNVTRASIAYLDSGQIATVDVSEEKLEEARGIAQGCVVAIADGKYKTKSKKNCHCDYANICRFKSN